MPQLSSFYGIVITMYFDDHSPPHFHAEYAEHEAKVDMDTLDTLRGHLPSRQMKLVRRWADLHRDELLANWKRARADEPLTSIAPLP
jgi:hypothetical protein